MRLPKLIVPPIFVGIILALLPLGRTQAAPLDPASFASLGANPFTQNGTYTINSSANPPTLSGPGLATPLHGAVANGIAVFTFNSLSLGSGITLQGTGTLPIALLSQANATVGGAINVSGSGGSGGSGGAGGPGGAGGGAGGTGGGEGGGGEGDGGGGDGGGGSYGGSGGTGGGSGSGPYGDLTQTLQGGSGGGGGSSDFDGTDGGGGGGGGGGALEIGAEAALAITGSIHADGGNAGQVFFWGGGGSGGGLIAFGSTVTLSGSARLSAVGGTSGYGGGGGGGRILIASEYPQAGNIATYVTVAGGATPDGSNGGDGVLTLAVGTVAQNASASVGHRSSAGVAVPLSASNASGHALSYSLVGTNGGAAHGTVSISGSTARYTPLPGNTFVGDDTFQFQATDGIAASAPATVTVHLTNTAPVAQPDSYQTAQNTRLSVATSGVLTNDTDADGDRLSAQLVTGPTHAASFALGADGSFTYTPTAGYFGTDSFTYKANDGYADSSAVTVTLTVVGVPTANQQSVAVAFNTAKVVTLSGSDPNSPARSLTYAVTTAPTHGTLSGTAPNLTYTPAIGYHGSDAFNFTVNNGTLTSSAAIVSLTVAIGVPAANAQSVSVAFNTTTAVTLTGSDPDVPALALTYTVTTNPAHGTLSGTAPNLTYTPAANYTGPDSFAFTARNGVNTSATATVSLTVNPVFLASLTFPTPVEGGSVFNGTVTLSGVTPTDMLVGLSSSNSATIRIHRSVLVPAGSSSVTFEIDTFRSHVTQTVTITAALNAVTLNKDLTITGR